MTVVKQWPIVQLQPRLQERFAHLIDNGRLAHAYLFNGTPESGTTALAQWIALRLFCSNLHNGVPCGQCANCQQILSGNHPDFLTIKPTGQTIKVDDIRYLRQEMSRTGLEQKRRVFVIDQADLLSAAAANSLLKFIEEPPGPVLIILLTEQKQRLLATILSRVQVIDFPPLTAGQMAGELTAEGLDQSLAPLFGALGADAATARELAESHTLNDMIQAMGQWLTALGHGDWQAFIIVQTRVMPLVKDKNSQILFLDLVVLALQDVVHYQYQTAAANFFPSEQTHIQQAAQELSPRVAADALTAALTTQTQLQGNVAFQGLMETLSAHILTQMAR